MKKTFPLDRKNYKLMETNIKEVEKGKKERVKEQIEKHLDGMQNPPPKNPDPVHQNFMTFTRYQKKWEGKGKNRKVRGPVKKEEKEPHFGKDVRFPKTEKQLMANSVRLFNQNNDQGKKIDPKQDPVPGPGYYKLGEVWTGKKIDSKKVRPYSANPKVGERIIKSISKGPVFSIYNSRGGY